MTHQTHTCRHCGCLLYEVAPQFVMHVQNNNGRKLRNPQKFVAPLRRRWYHNATANDIDAASKAHGIPTIHTPEP